MCHYHIVLTLWFAEQHAVFKHCYSYFIRWQYLFDIDESSHLLLATEHGQCISLVLYKLGFSPQQSTELSVQIQASCSWLVVRLIEFGGFFTYHELSLNVFVCVIGLQRVTWVRKMWVTCLSVSCAIWETSHHPSSPPVSTLTFKLLSDCSSRFYSSQQVGLISWGKVD